MIDLADEASVPLTTLTQDTVTKLEQVLDPELPAVNPLDAWSRGGPDAKEQMIQGLSLMMQDPGVALGAVVQDRAPYGKVYPNYLEYMRTAHARDSGKPVALVAARQGTGYDESTVDNYERRTSCARWRDHFSYRCTRVVCLQGLSASGTDKTASHLRLRANVTAIAPGEAGALQLMSECGTACRADNGYQLRERHCCRSRVTRWFSKRRCQKSCTSQTSWWCGVEYRIRRAVFATHTLTWREGLGRRRLLHQWLPTASR